MQLIIPSIFALAMIVISYVQYKEYVKRKRAESIKEARENETRFIIEQKVMLTMYGKAQWWDNFNVGLYVQYLESK